MLIIFQNSLYSLEYKIAAFQMGSTITTISRIESSTKAGSTLVRYTANTVDPIKTRPKQEVIVGGGLSEYVGGERLLENSGNNLVYNQLSRLEVNPIKFNIEIISYIRLAVDATGETRYTVEFSYKGTQLGGTLSFVHNYDYTSLYGISKIRDIQFTPLLFSYSWRVSSIEESGYNRIFAINYFFPESNIQNWITVDVSLKGAISTRYYTEFAPAGVNLTSNLSKTLSQTPYISIKARMDIYYGFDLAQCVFVGKKTYNQYLPKFRNYVIGDNCTLSGKCLVFIGQTEDVLTKICGYGLLRYFLFQEITQVFTLEILKRRYDAFFDELVVNSPYRPYLQYLKELEEVARYFIY